MLLNTLTNIQSDHGVPWRWWRDNCDDISKAYASDLSRNEDKKMSHSTFP